MRGDAQRRRDDSFRPGIDGGRQQREPPAQRPRGIRLHEAPRGSWAAAAAAEKADEAKRFRDLPGACTEPPGATVSRSRQGSSSQQKHNAFHVAKRESLTLETPEKLSCDPGFRGARDEPGLPRDARSITRPVCVDGSRPCRAQQQQQLGGTRNSSSVSRARVPLRSLLEETRGPTSTTSGGTRLSAAAARAVTHSHTGNPHSPIVPTVRSFVQ
ncbi:unnamed protein product [Lampetra fluviatilis]